MVLLSHENVLSVHLVLCLLPNFYLKTMGALRPANMTLEVRIRAMKAY